MSFWTVKSCVYLLERWLKTAWVYSSPYGLMCRCVVGCECWLFVLRLADSTFLRLFWLVSWPRIIWSIALWGISLTLLSTGRLWASLSADSNFPLLDYIWFDKLYFVYLISGCSVDEKGFVSKDGWRVKFAPVGQFVFWLEVDICWNMMRGWKVVLWKDSVGAGEFFNWAWS